MNEYIITTGVALVISIIGYFLKRTMGRVDKHDADIAKTRERQIRIEGEIEQHNEAINEEKEDIKQIKENYTPKRTHIKDMDECKIDIKKIKEDYIMKEDFYREINKVDRKLDYITDIMIKTIGAKGEN